MLFSSGVRLLRERTRVPCPPTCILVDVMSRFAVLCCTVGLRDGRKNMAKDSDGEKLGFLACRLHAAQPLSIFRSSITLLSPTAHLSRYLEVRPKLPVIRLPFSSRCPCIVVSDSCIGHTVCQCFCASIEEHTG